MEGEVDCPASLLTAQESAILPEAASAAKEMTFATLFENANQKQSDKAHDRAKRKERPPKQEVGTVAAEGAVKPEKKKTRVRTPGLSGRGRARPSYAYVGRRAVRGHEGVVAKPFGFVRGLA